MQGDGKFTLLLHAPQRRWLLECTSWRSYETILPSLDSFYIEVSIGICSRSSEKHLPGRREKDTKLNWGLAEWCARCIDHSSVNVCIQFDCEIWFNLELVTIVWIRRPDVYLLAVRE
jgi:hypothetical protein